MRPDYSRTIPPAWQGIAEVFSALGDDHRQRILLTFEQNETLTAGQLAEVSTLARPTVSHHLKVLREAGVLESYRQGKEVYYRIRKDYLLTALEAVMTYIREEV